MLDFLRTGRRPVDARALLEEIMATYPDREKCLQIFIAAVLDDRRYMRSIIEHAFETWTEPIASKGN